jgi:hypothetical protein
LRRRYSYRLHGLVIPAQGGIVHHRILDIDGLHQALKPLSRTRDSGIRLATRHNQSMNPPLAANREAIP